MQIRSIALQEQRRSFHSSRKSFSPFFRLLDMTIITLVYFFVLAVNHVNIELTSMLLPLVYILGYKFFAEVMNLYRLGRAPSNILILKKISIVCCLASLLTATFAFVLPNSVPYRTNLTLLLNLALTLPLLMILRAAFTYIICILRVKGYDSRTAIIIGTAPSAYKLAIQLEDEKHLGINFTGFYDDRKSGRVPNNMQYRVLGDVNKALELAQTGQVDYVFIGLPLSARERVVNLLQKFSNCSVEVNLISDPYVDSLIDAQSQQIGSIQTINLVNTTFQNFGLVFNRRNS